MPTYEYRCKDCGEQLEVVQSFSDDPLTQCPRCSGTLRKVFYTPGISFKGSGFYKTDSRSSAGSSSAGSSSASSDTSSDSATSSSSGDGGTSSSSGDGGTSSSSGDGGSSGTSASPPSSSSTAEAAAR